MCYNNDNNNNNNNNNNGFIYSWIKTVITKNDLIKNIYTITNSYKICITKMYDKNFLKIKIKSENRC